MRDRPSLTRRMQLALLTGILPLAFADTASAVTKTCGADPVANTTTILCAGSSICNGSSVTVRENIDLANTGCTFDLGNRAFSNQRTIQIIGGNGFMLFNNAGNVTVTDTGKFKARGDENPAGGFITSGGLISITSSGTITAISGALFDTSGDAAGTVRLTAVGDVTLNGGGAAEVIRGSGISSFVDEGERFADGGTLEVTSTTGSILIAGPVQQPGANQAAGGTVDLQAARNIDINQSVDCSGGGSDGGEFTAAAGDNINIRKNIDLDSRVGGGFGGTMTIAAGEDLIGGVLPGGTVLVDAATLKLNGSDSETSGGDGGDLEISSLGPITFQGSGVGIVMDGGVSFDGSGGSVFMDSGDFDPNVLSPLDGTITIAGLISATSGGAGGDGGAIDISAGRDFTLTATVNINGIDGGGDFTGDVGGAILLNGTVTAQGTLSTSEGGFLDFTAGLAQAGAAGGLTVAKNILAYGGSQNGGGQSISFSGCTLTVNDNVVVDGHAGVSLSMIPGGSDIELISRAAMQLRSGSQYLANPGGSITTTHPPGANPVIGGGVVFNPPRIDNEVTSGPFSNCPVCGDSVRQAGEVCDNGPGADGSCCNASCTAFLCITPTPTPTITATRTPTATRTRTPTPTRTSTPVGTPTPGTCGDGVVSPDELCDTLLESCCDVTCDAYFCATATPTPTPTNTLNPTPTRTATPSATPTVTVTATLTVGPTASPSPGLANLDHFKCYKAKTLAGTTAFQQQQVMLTDRYETKNTRVVKPFLFCNAVDKDGQGIVDPTAHLECYKIKDVSGQARFLRQDVVAENEFGVQPLTVLKSQLLCVPSLMDGQPSALNIDSFKCYKAKIPTGLPKFASVNTVLTDLFESKTHGVVKPFRICNPADQDGAGVLNPTSQLHCYKLKYASGQEGFTRRNAGSANAFGSETLNVQKPDTVCILGERPEPPMCGDGILDPGETCDDHNTTNGDGCSSTCTLESCGDGNIDVNEDCDDGAQNGVNNCCSTTCQLLDPDEDGICNRDDICPADDDNDSDADQICIGLAFNPPATGGGDPCSRTGGAGAWAKPQAKFTALETPLADDKIKLQGEFIVPTGSPAIAPHLFGVQVRITDAQGNLVLDQHIPPGIYGSGGLFIGWKVVGSPPVRWTYFDKVNDPPLHNGINKIVISDKSSRTPGLIKIVVKGKKGLYGITPGQEPLKVTVELNDTGLPPGALPGVDKCGEAQFLPVPAEPNCEFSGGEFDAAKLTCK